MKVSFITSEVQFQVIFLPNLIRNSTNAAHYKFPVVGGLIIIFYCKNQNVVPFSLFNFVKLFFISLKIKLYIQNMNKLFDNSIDKFLNTQTAKKCFYTLGNVKKRFHTKTLI